MFANWIVILELCKSMTVLGDTFEKGVSESDPEHTQKIASAYNAIVKGCADEPLENAVGNMILADPR